MIKDVKNSTVHYDLQWQQAPTLKKTVGPEPALHKQLQQKVLSLHRLVGAVVRASLQRGVQLEAIGPIG